MKNKQDIIAKLSTLKDPKTGQIKAVASMAFYFGNAFEGVLGPRIAPVKVTEVKGMEDRQEIGEMRYAALEKMAQ